MKEELIKVQKKIGHEFLEKVDIYKKKIIFHILK